MEDELVLQEYIQQGQVLLGNQNYAEAVEYFDKALEIDSKSYSAYISKSIAEINLDNIEIGEECIKRAIMIDKNNPDAYVHKGNIELIKNNNSEAIKNYNSAIALGYQNADVFYFLGLVYENENEIDLAIRNYTKASRLDELNSVYRVRKASIQIMAERYTEALQTLEELRKISPDSFEGYHLAAAVYTMQEKYNEADEVLAFAESLFPDDIDILKDRIRILISKGALDEAVERVERLEREVGEPVEKKSILLYKAQILGQQEKTEIAKETLVKALESGENEDIDAEIRYLLMNFYLIDKDYTNVLLYAEQLSIGKSENLYALGGKYYVALASKEQGKEGYEKLYKEAIRYYRSISLEEPSRIEAYLFRALCLKDLKEYEKALELVDYVMTLHPNVGQIHMIKGNIYMAMKDCASKAKEEYVIAKKMGVKMLPGMEV